MVDELLDEITKEFGEDFDKKVSHKEKVEPVTKAIENMAQIWKTITTKLVKDNICFLTKEQLGENEAFDIIQVPDYKLPKGMVAFVCVAKKNNEENKK